MTYWIAITPRGENAKPHYQRAMSATHAIEEAEKYEASGLYSKVRIVCCEDGSEVPFLCGNCEEM